MKALRIALLVLFGAVPLARGDDDPDREIAERHFRAGAADYARKEYEAALAEFREGQRAKAAPAFDYNIARCYDRLEQAELAVIFYRRFLERKPDSPDAAEIRARIDVLVARARVAPLPVEKPSPRRFVAPAVVGVAAAALAITGTVLVATVKPDYDALLMSCTAPPCDYSGLAARADAGYALWAIAGATAIADLVLWIVAARSATVAHGEAAR